MVDPGKPSHRHEDNTRCICEGRADRSPDCHCSTQTPGQPMTPGSRCTSGRNGGVEMAQTVAWAQLAQPGACASCGTALAAQAVLVANTSTGQTWCVPCCTASGQQPPSTAIPVAKGTPGASARREYERRRAADEQRSRNRWGRFGRLAVGLSEPRGSTTV